MDKMLSDLSKYTYYAIVKYVLSSSLILSAFII